MKVLSYCIAALVSTFHLYSVHAQYTATVVEHNSVHEGESAESSLLLNAQRFIQRLTEARNAESSIIVFPEYGLTGEITASSNLTEISTQVPDPAEFAIPCGSSNYSKALIDLSCAVQERSIYAVVNLIENTTDSSNNTIYYNTNVVFNRQGAVIAKYRKINLYDEPYLTAGSEIVTFSTDFGVTFGIFTGSDIAYKTPALDILANNTVTDIVYPTYWQTQVPFASGLSVQAGYNRANGVNLLAAALSRTGLSSSGSGVYFFNGTIANTFIQSVSGEAANSASVPLQGTRNPYICDNQITSRGIGGIIGGSIPPATEFPALVENLQNYTLRNLDLVNNNLTSERVCSGTFCCTFDISVENAPSDVNHTYKLAAFYGVKSFGNKTIGVRVCGLVGCSSDDVSSCGNTLYGNSITFGSISVSGTFTNNSNTYDQPITLLNNMVPLSIDDYVFCVDGTLGSSSVNVSLTTRQSVSGLRAFGIAGRVFNNDNLSVGTKSNAITLHNFTSICIFMLGFFLLYV